MEAGGATMSMAEMGWDGGEGVRGSADRVTGAGARECKGSIDGYAGAGMGVR